MSQVKGSFDKFEVNVHLSLHCAMQYNKHYYTACAIVVYVRTACMHGKRINIALEDLFKQL